MSVQDDTTAPTPDIVEGADQNLQDPNLEADASPAPETVAEETDENKAARLVKERDIRDKRERNKAAAERRVLENERDSYRKLTETFADVIRQSKAAPEPPRQQVRAPTRDFNPDTGKPYDSYEDFVAGFAAHRAEVAAAKVLDSRLAQSAEETRRTTQAREAQSVMDAHVARNVAFARSVPDFAEVTSREDIQIPPAAVEAIKRLNNGPAVLYAIGKDDSIHENLNRMGALEQVVYIGQLSHWAASTNPQISNAAPAGRTVGSKPASSGSPPSDPEAYMAWANKKFGR